MLTGSSYDDVIKYMGIGCTDARRIRNGLGHFGLKTAERMMSFRSNKRYRRHTALPFDAVLKLVHPRIHRDGGYHWVVWDARRRKILDPDDPPFKLPQVDITQFLAIIG
jgi:hypothetical protein